MKHTPNYIQVTLRMLALAAALTLPNAYADDYADVSQLMRSGKFSEALAKAEQYLSNKPRDPQMRFLKGVIQRDTGKTAEALTTFTRLTEDYPELPEPYNNLAVLYAGQSQFDKARAALEMAIRTNPSYSTAHENLGDVYAKLASQAYNKALQLDANNPAVAPKLALIRELFNPAAKGQKPATSLAPVTSAASGSSGNNSNALALKPPPTLPGPVLSPGKGNSTPITVALSPATTTPAAKVSAPVVVAQPVIATPAVTATPALPAHAATPISTAETGNATANKDIQAAVRAWASAWSARNVKEYLAAYGKDFNPPGAMSRADWESERRQRISSKSKISVKLENLTVSVNGNKASAKFRQDYKANGFATSSRKSLDLIKSGERWVIVKESIGD